MEKAEEEGQELKENTVTKKSKQIKQTERQGGKLKLDR
jgi:hypothetical protein